MSVLELSIPNDLKRIDDVNAAFDEFAVGHDLSETVCRSVKLVFDELLSNAISYAFDSNDAHELSIRVDVTGKRLAVTIVDDGKAFNPFLQAEPDPTMGLVDREIGGVGILLVKRMMDHVTYDRRGDENVLVLVKHLDSEDDAATS